MKNKKNHFKIIVIVGVILIITSILLILLLGKSEKSDYIGKTEAIEMVEFHFRESTGEYKRINLNFLEHSKTMFQAGREIEKDVKVEKDVEWKIQEILKGVNFEYKEKQTSEEDVQAVFWSIQVWTEDDVYLIDAFEGEDYPPYWNDLMNLLGETDYLQNTNT